MLRHGELASAVERIIVEVGVGIQLLSRVVVVDGENMRREVGRALPSLRAKDVMSAGGPRARAT
jgi:hypothetical protein